ncbi:energy transducer TonB [Arcobacter arenosus]|uniref:TonB family protein n=1 Tax=Arcobacter arenosus TaxID=2576037 RepID=A0A5R8Y333_9BACT|nr:energy transducer TonB [Arcobacter arenosus]TLP40489.1 TonB family protein [Arcobacter arenosus]
MKLIILAFILSLSLHFLFFSSLEKKEEIKQSASTSKKINKSSINYVKLMPKPVQKPIEKSEPKKVVKPEVKKTNPKNFKVVDKKKIVPQQKKPIAKEAKKIIPKPVKKVEVKPTPTKQIPKKTEIKPQEKRKTIPNKSLENFLLAEPIPLDKNMLDDITKSYLRLYGEEYNSFTKVQKVYLQKNLKNIGRITQKYLKYPRIAIRTGQQGMNIVEFFLHPNGDISDLKLSNSSGYTSLDKNTIETIEIAYKDYPRPKTKTKVKIYVYYKLY